jgi:hypothetical protein
MPDMTGNCALHVAAEAGNEAAARVLLPLLGEGGVDQRNLHLSDYSQGAPPPLGAGSFSGAWRRDGSAWAVDAAL